MIVKQLFKQLLKRDNQALQPNPIKEKMRTRGVGGVAMGIKGDFGALKGAPEALFAQSQAFQWRNCGVVLVLCCFTDHWKQFASGSLNIPGLIL